jgi:hypothetical protein
MSRMNAEKLFGVPAQTFATVEPAVAWVVARLEGNGLRADSATVGRALERLMV